MKKILALLCIPFMACFTSHADTETYHGVTFSTVGNAYQNNTTVNSELLVKASVYGNRTTMAGLCVVSGGYMKINVGTNLTITHLYLDSNITIDSTGIGGDTPSVNHIAWNGNVSGHTINIANDSTAWVDVNASYTSINLANMQTGDIYLNTNGKIASSMNSGFSGTIHAALEMSDTPAVLTRTLISGDFSSVDLSAYHFDFGGYQADTTGSLATLDVNADLTTLTSLAGTYTVFGDATGLKVTFVSVPEPATGTLSLLALAGLCARRRRK